MDGEDGIIRNPSLSHAKGKEISYAACSLTGGWCFQAFVESFADPGRRIMHKRGGKMVVNYREGWNCVML